MLQWGYLLCSAGKKYGAQTLDEGTQGNKIKSQLTCRATRILPK